MKGSLVLFVFISFAANASPPSNRGQGPGGGGPQLTATQQSCLANLGISKPTSTQQSCMQSKMQDLQSSLQGSGGIPSSSQMDAIGAQIDAIQTSCGMPTKDQMEQAASQCGISMPSQGPPPGGDGQPPPSE